LIFRACFLTALIVVCFPPKELLAPQTVSPRTELRLERDWILASIYKANEETVSFREYRGQKIRPITKERAEALAHHLQSQARKDPAMFYGAWFPTLWTGAGFWNGHNDAHRRRSRKTWGYSELQVRTSRIAAVITGHKIPKGMSDAESYLINEWKGNLAMGKSHMKNLWIYYDKNDLNAMNAYAAGMAGTDSGKWVVNQRQKEVRTFCMGFRDVLESLARRESKGERK
jgi:hypothetical protein